MKKETENRFVITGLFLFFILITFAIDNTISILLHPLLAAARKTFQYSFTSLIMLRLFSLLAVFLATFSFGFLRLFTCKRAGLWASLYIFFSWLAMFYALSCSYMKIENKVVIYYSLIYIATIVAAYYVGVATCSLSKKTKQREKQ